MFPRRALIVASLLVGLVSGAAAWSGLFGQLHAQFFEERLTSSQRVELYDALHREVAELERQGNVLKTVVRLVNPTVVHIEAKKRETGGRRLGASKAIDEAGSGVIIEHRGRFYVLTNRHVVRDAAFQDIAIHVSDGRQLHPTELWADPDTDVAVAAVSATDLVAARLGNSDAVEIGDFVLAVGSPFGLSQSVTFGIISAKGRRDLRLGDDGVKFQDFLQTDAAINPGNSGGPLVNLRGEVIGLNTAIASSSGGNEGIGFSIPINMAMVVARQLIERGAVSRAYMGVTLDSKFGPLQAAQLGLPRVLGARVTGITPNSPAAAAGLQVDDVVLDYDGIRVENDSHLISLVSLTEVGKEVRIGVFRGRRQITLVVKVGDRAKFEQRAELAPPTDLLLPGQALESALSQVEVWDIGELGLSVVNIDQRMARLLRLSDDSGGLLVAEVDPRGPAAGRIKKGEIIDHVEQRPVRRVEDLDQILASADAHHGLRLHLLPQAGGAPFPRTVLIQPQVPAPR